MSQRQIVLDESKETPPLAEFIVVETEVDFLLHDGADKLWVRGEICDYVRALYRSRQVKVTDVVSPRVRLHSLLGATADTLDSSLIIRSLEVLDQANPKSVGELLFHLTQDEVWVSQPSVEHAARFLITNVDTELLDLAEAQRDIWLGETQEQKVNSIYAQGFDEREQLLRKWLFDEGTRKTLGEFPLLLSDKQAEILGDEVGRRLRMSKGGTISEFPKNTLNKKIYAEAAIEYFSHNPIHLTSDYISQMSSLLSSVDRSQLERLLPQSSLPPLDINADLETALKWAIEGYLPFKSFEVESNRSEEGDVLAATFADWMLENYPRLTNADRETSPINIRTFYTVKSLSEEHWVLWVVVDGLNYTNHRKLLQLLAEKSASLRVAQNHPLLAVLPTITEKAKYGLTTGKFPQENHTGEWGTQNVFLTAFPRGVYAGNGGASKLSEGLNREVPTVCYWNYTSIDDCFHDETDLAFTRHEVDGQLRSLAGKINQLVVTARNPNHVAVVICSDHGQVLGHCRKLRVNLKDQRARGRTVLADIAQPMDRGDQSFAKNADGETVFLNPKSFRLSEPSTLALGSTYFVDWGHNPNDEAIGVHGGLYPEEVVVGMSVLMRQPLRKLLTAIVSGTGETGKAGSVILEIDNPNSATVTPLSVNVEGLQMPDQGKLLSTKIRPHQTVNLEMTIPEFPIPQEREEFLIQGVLRYDFDDGAQEECAISGKLLCKSLYSAKNPKLRDRF